MHSSLLRVLQSERILRQGPGIVRPAAFRFAPMSVMATPQKKPITAPQLMAAITAAPTMSIMPKPRSAPGRSGGGRKGPS